MRRETGKEGEGIRTSFFCPTGQLSDSAGGPPSGECSFARTLFPSVNFVASGLSLSRREPRRMENAFQSMVCVDVGEPRVTLLSDPGNNCNKQWPSWPHWETQEIETNRLPPPHFSFSFFVSFGEILRKTMIPIGGDGCLLIGILFVFCVEYSKQLSILAFFIALAILTYKNERRRSYSQHRMRVPEPLDRV